MGGANPQEVERSLDAHRGLGVTLLGTVIVLVLGLVVWRMQAPGPHSAPRTAAEREVAANELLSEIRMSAHVSGSSLAASKALVDYLAQNDVRLVLVRIVDNLDLEIHIEAPRALAFREPPSLCLIGPFSAPDDAGYASPCWGTPDIGELVAGQLPVDGAGHAMFPADREIVLTATVDRGGTRCDYPPGRWLLVVKADPLMDGAAVGARQLAELSFDIPWASGPLPLLPVREVAYCGSANVVYRQQGEPQIASSSPVPQ